MTLQEKILDAFLGKVVRKDLAFLVKGGLLMIDLFPITIMFYNYNLQIIFEY